MNGIVTKADCKPLLIFVLETTISIIFQAKKILWHQLIFTRVIVSTNTYIFFSIAFSSSADINKQLQMEKIVGFENYKRRKD